MTENFSTEHAPAGGYDLVVFDWDGTILDTTAAISLSIQRAAEKMGLPVPSTQRANAVIGLGWREAIQIVAPTCPVEEYRTFFELLCAELPCARRRSASFPWH